MSNLNFSYDKTLRELSAELREMRYEIGDEQRYLNEFYLATSLPIYTVMYSIELALRNQFPKA